MRPARSLVLVAAVLVAVALGPTGGRMFSLAAAAAEAEAEEMEEIAMDSSVDCEAVRKMVLDATARGFPDKQPSQKQIRDAAANSSLAMAAYNAGCWEVDRRLEVFEDPEDGRGGPGGGYAPGVAGEGAGGEEALPADGDAGGAAEPKPNGNYMEVYYFQQTMWKEVYMRDTISAIPERKALLHIFRGKYRRANRLGSAVDPEVTEHYKSRLQTLLMETAYGLEDASKEEGKKLNTLQMRSLLLEAEACMAELFDLLPPAQPETYHLILMGEVLAKLDRPSRALVYLEELHEREPTSYLCAALVSVYLSLGDGESARKYALKYAEMMKDAKRENDDRRSLPRELAMAAALQGEYADAFWHMMRHWGKGRKAAKRAQDFQQLQPHLNFAINVHRTDADISLTDGPGPLGEEDGLEETPVLSAGDPLLRAVLDPASETGTCSSDGSCGDGDAPDDTWFVPSPQQRARVAAVLRAEMEEGAPGVPLLDPADVSPEYFEREFVQRNRPALLKKGLIDDWAAHKLWTPSGLEERYGTILVRPKRIPTGGHNTAGFFNETSMMEYLQEDMAEPTDAVDYVFEVWKAGHKVTKDVSIPKLFEHDKGVAVKTRKEWNFMLGPAGSGSTMHHHLSAWNGLVRGLKLWFMLPPHESYWGAIDWPEPQTMLEWAEKALEGVRELGIQPHVFVQKPGEVVYVPDGWAHGILNLQPSVGISMQFKTVFKDLKTTPALREAKAHFEELKKAGGDEA